MPFQQTLKRYPDFGVPGDRATENPTIYTVQNYKADGAVTVAAFVWLSANGVKNSGTGLPIGFVERVRLNYNFTPLSEASMTISSGGTVTVARLGDFFVYATTAATVGQKIFANLTTGVIATGAAGATIAGSIETPWTVATAAAAGDVFIMTNY